MALRLSDYQIIFFSSEPSFVLVIANSANERNAFRWRNSSETNKMPILTTTNGMWGQPSLTTCITRRHTHTHSSTLTRMVMCGMCSRRLLFFFFLLSFTLNLKRGATYWLVAIAERKFFSKWGLQHPYTNTHHGWTVIPSALGMGCA